MLETTTHGPITRIRMAGTFLGRPAHDVSAYLVEGLLVDSGPPQTATQFADWCAQHPVERFVLTHHHEDHAGGAAAVAERLGVMVEAPEGALPILAEGARLPLYRKLVWGTPRPVRARRLGEEVACGGHRFQAVPTPGHAFDHVCLFEPERRWLFSGDLFVHERVKFLRRIEDLSIHLDSLRRVLALEPELLICSHAGFVADARGAIERKILFWEGLGEEARLLSAQGCSLRQITRKLVGSETLLTYLSLGDFSKRNLMRALLRLV